MQVITTLVNGKMQVITTLVNGKMQVITTLVNAEIGQFLRWLFFYKKNVV